MRKSCIKRTTERDTALRKIADFDKHVAAFIAKIAELDSLDDKAFELLVGNIMNSSGNIERVNGSFVRLAKELRDKRNLVWSDEINDFHSELSAFNFLSHENSAAFVRAVFMLFETRQASASVDVLERSALRGSPSARMKRGHATCCSPVPRRKSPIVWQII